MQTRYSEENSVCPSVCPSVRPSVCPSDAWSLTKWKKDRSRFYTIRKNIYPLGRRVKRGCQKTEAKHIHVSTSDCHRSGSNNNCRVLFSIGKADHTHTPDIRFHNVGLWGDNTIDRRGWRLEKLSTIRSRLGHQSVSERVHN